MLTWFPSNQNPGFFDFSRFYKQWKGKSIYPSKIDWHRKIDCNHNLRVYDITQISTQDVNVADVKGNHNILTSINALIPKGRF